MIGVILQSCMHGFCFFKLFPIGCIGHIKSHKLMGILWAHTGVIGCIYSSDNIMVLYL